MTDRFFEKPILNSPYEYPARHWELDKDGQPTQQIIEKRRTVQFITPIPKPRKRKATASTTAQGTLVLGEGAGVSTDKQLYDLTRHWSTTGRDVKNGNVGHIMREREQVKGHSFGERTSALRRQEHP